MVDKISKCKSKRNSNVEEIIVHEYKLSCISSVQILKSRVQILKNDI